MLKYLTLTASSTEEALVMTHDHLRLHLADRLNTHGNRDQHAARSERSADAEDAGQQGRDGRQHGEEQGAEQRQTAGHAGEIIARRAALADAGMMPPFCCMFLLISTGLKVMLV